MIPGNETTGALLTLEEEIIASKNALQALLKNSSDNLGAHRVSLAYLGKVIEIIKIRAETQAQDPDRLLIDTLKVVVMTLMELGETQAAEVLGESLPMIGEKVKNQWLHPRGPSFPEDTKKSSSSSKPPSGLSQKPARRKKKPAEGGPKPT